MSTKIDIRQIIYDHVGTLRNSRSNKYSLIDYFTFGILPLMLSIFAVILKIDLSDTALSASIAVFGIFCGLLLNLQTVTFSIFGRGRRQIADKNLEGIQKDRHADRSLLLKEINANLSYLVIFAILSIGVFVILLISSSLSYLAGPLSAFIYSHFFLTLLMVVKRAHILFREEYTTP